MESSGQSQEIRHAAAGELSISDRQIQYVSCTEFHSRRKKHQTLFPGLNYGPFQAFFQSASKAVPHSAISQERQEQAFLFLYMLPATTSSGNTSSQQQQQDQSDTVLYKLPCNLSLRFVSPFTAPASNSGQIIFMRGFANGDCIKALGSFYRIDPEYFRRHIDYLSATSNCYDLPSLPSANFGFLRLRVTDLFKRQVSLSNQNVQTKRQDEARAVRNYQNRLGSTGISGESIVRRFSVHDGTTFSTEHDISITVQRTPAGDGGWTAIVWSDVGSSLNHCPEGPWLDQHHFYQQSNSPQATCVATTLQKPYVATGRREMENNSDQLDRQTEGFFQSASLLPEQYGSTLDSEAMSADAFYALSEVFLFVATSEKQFLNYMELLVNHEIYSAEEVTDFSINNLKHSRELLERHHQSLNEALKILRKARLIWPTPPPNYQKSGIINSKYEATIDDFKYLVSRAQVLSVRCLEGITIITNSVMLQESRKVMDQGKQTKILTLLAFYYLPITMTFGFFGMNFKELGQGELSIWIGIAAGIVLLGVQHLGYIFKHKITWLWHTVKGRRV